MIRMIMSVAALSYFSMKREHQELPSITEMIVSIKSSFNRNRNIELDLIKQVTMLVLIYMVTPWIIWGWLTEVQAKLHDVLFDSSLEGLGFQINTAVSLQGAIEMFWLHFWGAVLSSIVT